MEPNNAPLDSVTKHRRVIPRWKSPQQAVEVYCIDNGRLLERQRAANSWLKRLATSYDLLPSPHTANELYETASLYDRVSELPDAVVQRSAHLRSEGERANVHLLQYGASPKNTNLDLDGAVNDHERLARQEIHRLRKLLSDDPNRPFCWSELSRHFSVVAEKEKSVSCMQAALQLGKHNRYLCRAAARLFVHVQDIDRALHLLRAEPDIKDDPWLLAAEIAISSITNKRSRFLDAGTRLMSSKTCDDKQLSELASALGTVELAHGTIKRAKELFGRSLKAPTENALAQAQWAVEQDSKIVIPVSAWSTPSSHEAITLASRQAHQWTNALRACAAWLVDEPFSSRPAIMGSYIAFRPENINLAEQFATAGLCGDKANFHLLNNRAVVRAYQGKIEAAYEDVTLALQQDDARNSAHLMATLGLIAFRSGMPDIGRVYYAQSISWLSQAKHSSGVASGILHLLREEIRLDSSFIPTAIPIVERIAKSVTLARHPEIIGMTELFFEETRKPTTDGREATSLVRSPASPDDLNYQASLFHVPEKAKAVYPKLSDFSKLVQP